MLARLQDLDPGLTIYAAGGACAPLEAETAQEVAQVWQAWRDGREPTLAELHEAIVSYASKDAYLPA